MQECNSHSEQCFCDRPAALVPPPVATSQDTVKESPFSSMIPTTSAMPGGFMSSAIPGASVFNAVGVQSQQHSSDKMPPSAKGLDGTAELTLQGGAT